MAGVKGLRRAGVPMKAHAWSLGWRIVVAVLVPFGWLVLVFHGGTASIWSSHLEREYRLWRWRRSYRATAYRLLDARQSTLAPDALGRAAPTTMRRKG